MKDLIKKISVALASKDILVVKVLANSKGLNFSSALRMIVREWDEKRDHERVQITDVGREALEATRKEE